MGRPKNNPNQSPTRIVATYLNDEEIGYLDAVCKGMGRISRAAALRYILNDFIMTHPQ